MNPVLSWWQERDEKERRFIQIGILVLVVVVLYVALFQPAFVGRARLLNTLPELRQQVEAMDAQVIEAHQLDAKGALQTPKGEALRDALHASLRDHGMIPTSIASAGPAVRFQLHDVAFANWTAWLDEVESQLHVKVSEAHVLALKPGQVDLTATLSPP